MAGGEGDGAEARERQRGRGRGSGRDGPQDRSDLVESWLFVPWVNAVHCLLAGPCPRPEWVTAAQMSITLVPIYS